MERVGATESSQHICFVNLGRVRGDKKGFGPIKGSWQVLQWVSRKTHELIKMQTVLLPSAGWRPGCSSTSYPEQDGPNPRE